LAAPFSLLWPIVMSQLAFVDGSDQQCPRPAAVEARVRAILGMRSADTLDERAKLVREGDELKIVVTRADGSVLGERVLSAAATCDDLETLASVVLASWISDVHPEFVAALPPPPSRAEMPSGAEAGAVPENAPPVPSPAKPPLATTVHTRGVEKQPPEPAQLWRWELGAAAGAHFSAHSSGARVSALGSLGVRWMPERSGFGAALTAHVVAPRTEPLSMGSVRYWRWPLVVGPAVRLPLGGMQSELHAGLALGWLHAAGRDFEPSETRDVPRGGGLVGLRGRYGGRRWLGFVDLSGMVWGKSEIFVDRAGRQPSIALPRLELYLTLGVAWAL
jgi:hypothetical protein